MNNYKTKCTNCGKEDKENPTFARIFYKKINEKWVFLCKSCWNKYSKSSCNLKFSKQDDWIYECETCRRGINSSKFTYCPHCGRYILEIEED